MIRLSVVTSIVCAALLVGPPARAAGGGNEDAAAAESLFQEARKLMDEKRYADACSKFAASQKIAPAIGTLLNLADCYEKSNQLANAYTRFREAVVLAQRAGRSNREQTARERAERLEPRITKLTILSHGPVDVKLDGALLDSAVLGTPIAIDPGRHTLEASAKGKKPFTTVFDIGDRMRQSSVNIPELEDEEKSAPEVESGAKDKKVVTPDETTRPSPEVRSNWSTQKTIGLTVAGAGVVGLGLGGYFGIKTSSTWNDAQPHCTGLECDQRGVDLASQAKTTGNIATVSVVAGSALLLGGAVLFLTAPKGKKTEPTSTAIRVGVGPGNILLGGVFR